MCRPDNVILPAEAGKDRLSTLTAVECLGKNAIIHLAAVPKEGGRLLCLLYYILKAMAMIGAKSASKKSALLFVAFH